MCAHALVDQLSGEIDAALVRINSRPYAQLQPTPATISTMTVTATLNVSRVCRDSMAIALSVVDGDGPLTVSSKHAAKRRKRPSSVFFNQITMRHGTKSVKVFYNGSMHVTGCTSLAEFWKVATAVCAFMGDVAGIETTDKTGAVCIQHFNVQMINMNFGAGKGLFLQELRDTCASLGYIASYDSDTYPGLNIKLPVGDRRITVLMFKSGKVIITGAKTADELDRAHAMITKVLDVA